MMRSHRDRAQVGDQGFALIVALFALLLISSVGAAILFMAANESSIVSNQRAYVKSWEAAKGGLEEARDRISSGDPSKFGASLPADATHILYVINPAGVTDTVDPAVSTNTYFDTEYNTEWGQPITSAGLTVTKVNSDMQTLLSGSILTKIPSYKWVRVTVKTESSANQDVNQDGTLDTTIPISYDSGTNRQKLVASPASGTIVYRATALSVLPNGTTRLFQYDLKPGVPIPPLPGAFNVCGTGGITVSSWPTSAPWTTSGIDAGTPPQPAVDGIADCDPTAQSTLDPGSWKGPGSVIGSCGTNPCVVNESSTMSPCLQNYACLQNLVATLTANATAINPSCSNLGTATAPAISVFTTNPNCAGGTNGYGVLLATSDFTFKGNATFNGIVLVIGTGVFDAKGTCCFNGGVFLAKTTGGVLGTPTFGISGGGNCGFTYNSSYINLTNNLFSYKVLAAREINQ